MKYRYKLKSNTQHRDSMTIESTTIFSHKWTYRSTPIRVPADLRSWVFVEKVEGGEEGGPQEQVAISEPEISEPEKPEESDASPSSPIEQVSVENMTKNDMVELILAEGYSEETKTTLQKKKKAELIEIIESRTNV